MSVTKYMLLSVFGVLLSTRVIQCEQYCLLCKNAQTVSDCTQSVRCGADEYCFTEEIVSPNGIIYNAGCKSSGACLNKAPSVGRRGVGDFLVACSKCCQGGARNETAHNCNEKLCGLLGTLSSSLQGLAHCYKCDQALDPETCNDLKTYKVDEMCGVQTLIVPAASGKVHEYTFGCLNKHVCLEATKRLLEYRKTSAIVGSGRRNIFVGCNICCGGNYCNTGDCIKLFGRLYQIYLPSLRSDLRGLLQGWICEYPCKQFGSK